MKNIDLYLYHNEVEKMDYHSFFEKLKAKDPRIEYMETYKEPECRKLDIPQFYKTIDPVNVEFEFNDGIVKLEPIKNLMDLNKQYRYAEADCVFATCNGDPIYVKNKKIFTCTHGSERIIEEQIAASMDSFFEMVYNTL